MPPKVLPKAKAKAAAKAKAKAAVAKAKAKAKAKAAAAIVPAGPMAAAGGAPAVAGVTTLVGAASPALMMIGVWDNANGSTEFRMTSAAVDLIYGHNGAAFMQQEVAIEATAGGKGFGKGTGPWAPPRGWHCECMANLTTAVPSSLELKISQDAYQFRLD